MSSQEFTEAAVIDRFGPPDVLHARPVPVPEPTPGQVRLRVAAAAVNPVDLGTREGRTIAAETARFPMILGWDAAGTVEAVGDGEQRWRVGEAVLAMSPQPATQVGTYAERVVLDAGLLAPLPAGLDVEVAATLPLAGLTARQALDALDLTAGQRLLVNGPVGAIGRLVLQLAAKAGVEVVAVVRADDVERAIDLGAAETVDRDNVVAQVDAALDVVGGKAAHAAFAAVRDGGRYVTVVPEWWRPGGPFDPDRGITPRLVQVQPDAQQLERLAADAASGTLRSRVEAVYALGDAGQAHHRQAAGALRGKLVIRP